MKVTSQICIMSKDLYVDVIFNVHAEVFIYKFCNMEHHWFITDWQNFVYAVKLRLICKFHCILYSVQHLFNKLCG